MTTLCQQLAGFQKYKIDAVKRIGKKRIRRADCVFCVSGKELISGIEVYGNKARYLIKGPDFFMDLQLQQYLVRGYVKKSILV